MAVALVDLITAAEALADELLVRGPDARLQFLLNELNAAIESAKREL